MNAGGLWDYRVAAPVGQCTVVTIGEQRGGPLGGRQRLSRCGGCPEATRGEVGVGQSVRLFKQSPGGGSNYAGSGGVVYGRLIAGWAVGLGGVSVGVPAEHGTTGTAHLGVSVAV